MAIVINGRSYFGSSLLIRGDQVIIDGKPQGDAVSGVVEVRITEGSPVSVQSVMDVRCIDVAGDVYAGMSVRAERSAAASGQGWVSPAAMSPAT